MLTDARVSYYFSSGIYHDVTEETPRPVHLPFGYDEEDPYEGEDTTSYPDWWRHNIQQFRECGLRPYRPPRFSDGEYVPEVINRLEAQHGTAIQIRSCNPHEGNDREVVVDGESIGTVDHERVAKGFTRYGIRSDEFEQLVCFL